jgi:hypothetical protein
MKKNFFKKLSFVLALAMIVSVIMPAAGAFAATKAPKLSATKKYLHLDKEGANEYDFNITNKGKNWKYEWSSANENVAEVGKNGLTTATGVGTTKVSVVITDKDGDEVDELTATVVVRDNIASVKITKVPTGKLAVGASNDFNRSFTTVSGSTKKTSSITRWTVKEEGATISDSGLFVATKAGEYTITATSFQSTAKYESWLTDSTKYASYALATDSVKVTVAASMVKAEQVDLNTFKVTFDSIVSDVDTKLTVSEVVGTAKVLQSVKSIKLDATGTVATVDMYTNFIEGDTYVVDYPDMESVQFVAAKSEATEVTSMTVTTKTAQNGKATLVEVALLNKDGVDIADDELKGRVTMETSSTSSDISGRTLYMFNVGETTTVTATYHTYNYDAEGKETGAIVASGVVVCTEYAETTVTGINAYSIVENNGNTADWVKVNHTIAADDANYNLIVKLNVKDSDGNDDTLVSSPIANTGITFASSNASVLIIDDITGAMSPVKAGAATVVVKYNDKAVGTIAITVSAKRVVSSVTLDTYSFALSDSAQVNDTKRVKLTVKDQLGTNMEPANYSVDFWETTSSDHSLTNSWTDAANGSIWNQAAFTFDGTDATPGTYSFAVKVTDDATNVSRTVNITVVVKTPTNNTTTYYRLETDKVTYDTNLETYDQTEDVTVSLFGYASNGVRNERIQVASAGAFTVEATKSGSNVSYELDGKNGVIKLADTVAVDATVSGGAIDKMDTGTYTLKVKQGTTVLHTTYFTVKDTQEKPTVAVDKVYSDTGKNAVLTGVKECFTITLAGYDITDDVFNVVSTGSSSTGQYNIKSVQYKEFIQGDAYILHTININRTITLAD